jgi:RNA polymerase sigma-70 factor (ECF subfamily)
VQASKVTTRSGNGPSDAVLVLAARAGEDWAREALFRRYASMVNGLAYRIMGRDDDVEDLVQDSFVQALSSLDRLRDPQAFAGWVASIVVRTAAKTLRRRKLLRRLGLFRGQTPIEPETLVATSTSPDVAAELRAVYGLVESLPVEQRMVLLLRRVEGLELDAIGRVVGRSLATVKRRLADAEAAMASVLAEGAKGARR